MIHCSKMLEINIFCDDTNERWASDLVTSVYITENSTKDKQY